MRHRLFSVPLLCLLLVAGCGPDSPEEVAASYFNRIGQNDVAGALELVSSAARQRYGDRRILSALGLMAGISALQGGIRVDQVRVVTRDENEVGIVVTGGYGGDNSNWGLLGLVREGSEWKVDGGSLPIIGGPLSPVDSALIEEP